MTFACSCANPACLVNGCQIANGYRVQNAPINPYPQVILMNQVTTVEQIRQIVREELEKNKGAALAKAKEQT